MLAAPLVVAPVAKDAGMQRRQAQWRLNMVRKTRANQKHLSFVSFCPNEWAISVFSWKASGIDMQRRERAKWLCNDSRAQPGLLLGNRFLMQIRLERLRILFLVAVGVRR
jgi:hypothetical protein